MPKIIGAKVIRKEEDLKEILEEGIDAIPTQTDKRIKCIFCNKPIHIDNWAGVNKEGFFCGNTLCLMQLAQKVDDTKDAKGEEDE